MVKGSSLLLPGGLGPPVQILPQTKQHPHPSCAFTSRSTSSYFYSCRPVHQHSSLPTRQQVLFIDIKSQDRNFSLKDFRSSFHGDAGALKKQKPWPEKKVKEVGNLFPIKITPIRRPKQFRVVQSSSRPFNESHRPRGSFPSLGTQTSTAPEPKSPTANSDQNKTRYFKTPGSLDPIGSSSPPDYVQPVLKARFYPKEVPKGSTSSEQRRSCLKEESKYEQWAPNPNSSRRSAVKFEPSYVLAEKSVPGSSKAIASSNQSSYSRDQWEPRVKQDYIGGHQTVRRGPDSGARLLSKSHATPMSLEKIESGVESAFMVPDQFRNSQNGAHPAPHNYRIPSASGKQRYDRSVIRQAPSSPLDAFRYQWWLQRMGAEAQSRREAEHPLESSYRREPDASLGYQGARRQGNNNVAQLEASLPSERGYSREPEPFRGYQGARGQGHSIVAQLEAPPPRARVEGSGKWREAAISYELNRNPSHRVSAIGTRRQNTDSLTSELERARDISTANLNRSSTANEVMRFHEPRLLPREEEGQSADISEGGVFENSVRQDVVTERLDRFGAGISTANLNRSSTGNEVLRFHEPGLLPREEEGQFADISEGGVCDSSVRWDVVTEKLDKSGVGGYSQQANLSNEQDYQKQQWMNADVLVVNNAAVAEAVVEKLRDLRDLTHACDTEVSHIDVKKESPVGHGSMICFSIYCGPEPDFGGGKCRIWVDVLGKPEVLEIFKPYFEDPNIKKVWHNYSFDKHILANHGIHTQGFHADTMHLARLYDSARTVAQGGYSLEGLTSDKNLMGDHWGELKFEEESGGKRSMKHIFGKPNIKKNGEEGKLRVVPPVQELQTQPEWQEKWIHYSSFDTVCTWCLWKSLKEKLRGKPWLIEGKFIQGKRVMYDFYLEYVRPFGELLIQMEADGMMLDSEHLAKIEAIAIEQQEFAASRFKKWAAKRCPDAIYMNVGSDAQIRQLLFGGKANKNDPDKRLEMERIFNAPNTENYIEEGRKIPKKTRPFTLRGLGVDIPVDTYTSGGWPAVGADALKDLAGKVSIDYNMLAEEEPAEDLLLEAESAEVSAVLTSTGIQGGSEEDLSLYGKAYKAFGGGREGKEACMALAALCEVSSINTLISNFIQPLQGNDIKGPDGRIHCSLNINTETGRLSARRPSLQNQPALEKDRYKIRQAFVAAPGKSLIVADYGQLELRVLAHLTDCKSMLKAFSDGGDFHSRTAMNMYAHVRNAVERGDVILEWEPKPGEKKPPVPLLKDVFGAERRKAKMLNFSIAYGKTPMGLSKDWKVSLDEAKATVKLWYSDRQEVLRWQEERIQEATKTHHVHTLLGRTRHFPDVTSSSPLIRGHISRAAINTPVQGSAADVAMCAMLQINRNKTLQDLGWRLLLQVHDEVILEGPSESAAVARDVVVNCMGFPFGGKNILRVALAVDAKFAQNWYAAK